MAFARDGNGNEDRTALFPAVAKEPLQANLKQV